MEASSRYVSEKRRCVRVRKGTHGMVTPPMKMKQCSETSIHKIQKPGNDPKERAQYSEQDKSFRSRVDWC